MEEVGHMFYRYRPYEKGEFILVAADTSAGGADYSAVQFLSSTNRDVPVVYHSKVTATEMTPKIQLELERIFDETKVKPVVAYETNNGGSFLLDQLAVLNRLGKYTMYQQKKNVGTSDTTEEGSNYGFSTNSATRPAILQLLKQAIDERLIRVYHKATVNEMFSFIVAENGKPQAEQGAHDDLIMSLAIAWQMYQTESPPKQRERKQREIKRTRKFHI